MKYLPHVCLAIILAVVMIPATTMIAAFLDQYRANMTELERAKSDLSKAKRYCGRPKFLKAGIVA